MIAEQVIASSSAPPVSKKFQRQQELAALKESRIAEERERAANNRRNKEERATRRAEEERQMTIRLAEEASRHRAESEECQRLEELRRVQEERKAREQVVQEKLIQDERETRARLEREKLERQRSEKEKEKLERETVLKAECKPTTATVPVKAATMPANIINSITSPPISNPKEEERKAAHRAKMKEKCKVKQAQRYQEKKQVEDGPSSLTKKPPLSALVNFQFLKVNFS